MIQLLNDLAYSNKNAQKLGLFMNDVLHLRDQNWSYLRFFWNYYSEGSPKIPIFQRTSLENVHLLFTLKNDYSQKADYIYGEVWNYHHNDDSLYIFFCDLISSFRTSVILICLDFLADLFPQKDFITQFKLWALKHLAREGFFLAYE